MDWVVGWVRDDFFFLMFLGGFSIILINYKKTQNLKKKNYYRHDEVKFQDRS